ncbi:hypothetical protein P378_09855 [Desulforamulus profundi]|uniref:Uncharacterized protein n=1 Tax=Desulforamulus profundi TaxID=1383067 RepID=A0A2C6MG89_9FIRM|nr:hypothetical protein [Desulforamulus profundi]MCL4441439.1 hypothetical protein [Bacillota bacterium]MCL5780416.1 hypothetical protein [Bacillota bacterium]PHJ38463.1 hypothetical protein P378_09855 [Desulforamulus profundi]
MRDSTWRYPNFGFWAVHVASLAAMGYLAYKAADCRYDADDAENRAFAERMPKNREPQADQF